MGAVPLIAIEGYNDLFYYDVQTKLIADFLAIGFGVGLYLAYTAYRSPDPLETLAGWLERRSR